MKYINIHHHFIHEVEGKELHVSFCGTEEMLVDVLTKGLSKSKHVYFIRGMGVKEGVSERGW
jgi:hypothetical protein